MKNQALFSSEDKSKTLKCCLLQFLFCVLRVNAFLSLLNLFLLKRVVKISSHPVFNVSDLLNKISRDILTKMCPKIKCLSW